MAKGEETVAIEISAPPYKLSPEQVAQELGTNLESGLTVVAAKQNLDKYGPNKLDGGEGVAIWEVLFKQVRFYLPAGPRVAFFFVRLVFTTGLRCSSLPLRKRKSSRKSVGILQWAIAQITKNRLLTFRRTLTGRKRHDSCPYPRHGIVLWCPRLG